MGRLLEKKIQELETQLTPLLVSPAGHEPESTGDIQAKFGFLNNLLAREIEVNSQNNPEHLGHVAGRLALLEAAFHNWNNSHAYINNNYNNHLDDDDDVHVHDDGDLLLKTIIPDCSCTHSCLIDDDDDDNENEEVQEENDKNESDEKFKRNEEKEKEEKEKDDDDDDGEKKEVFEKNTVEFRRFGGVAVVVVVVLAVVMKIWVVEEEDFLVPT